MFPGASLSLRRIILGLLFLTMKTSFWPGVWTMGNLGRAGYGATTEGEWAFTPTQGFLTP